MRIALQPDIPGLIDQLHQLAPGIEAFILPTGANASQQYEADVLLCTAADGSVLPDLIASCRGLRWIHVLGTGIDKFPLHLSANSIVSCSRGATATPIAEWVISMMLAHEKQLPERWLSEPPKTWYMADLGCLENKTLGIIGFGAIGQAVAKRALAFDMQVIAKVRTHRQSPVEGVKLVEDLHELLTVSDHVVLALPATNESNGLMNAETLSLMKPAGHLVNISRANLIDQEALRAMLDKGHIARASLDVVEPEPLPAGHWMYSHAGIKLSAHISWSGPNITQRLLAPFLHNVLGFANNQALQGVVDKTAGY